MALLELLGVGHAPLTIVLMLLLAFFGLTGLALNSLLWNLLGSYPGLALAGVLPAAFLVASLGTGRSAVFLGQLVPPLDTTATGMAQLVGRTGIVASPRVDEAYGQVRVRDRGGTMITVFGITQPGAAPLARGSQALLVHYDPGKRLFTVVQPPQ
jgi:membrane protein implicated in regulation of membrane protease activity